MKKRVFPAFLAVLALCIPAAPATAAIDTTTNTYFLKNASTLTLIGPPQLQGRSVCQAIPILPWEGP